MADRILVTGGTGTTGRIVAALLRERDIAIHVATRRPAGPEDVRFEWNDAATFGPALKNVTAAYLVAPTDRTDHLAAMRPFLEEAVRRGVGPLVLLSAASLPEGGPMMGAVQAWLHEHAPRWISLRPSWFMQNFVTQHLPGILAEGRLYSATGDGRVAFIDAVDIAKAAVAALTARDLPSGEVVLTGPEALSYDEVAAAITDVAGKPVSYFRMTVTEMTDRHAASGLPRDYAALLAGMDAPVAAGAEDRTSDGVLRLTGDPPTPLAAFLAREACRFKGVV